MREQAKSVSAFAANPLRARILIRELERKCLEVKPAASGEKFDRYEHLNRFIACHRNSKKRFDLPRRPFFRWRNGEALPNLTNRRLIDGLFDVDLGSKRGGRSINGPEQTLLVALDLISRSNAPNNQETLTEAEEILAVVNSAVCDLIPRIPNLKRPKFTSYRGGKALTSSANQKSSRYAVWSKKRPVAYPFIVERINPYDSVSPLCAALLYLVKPNIQTYLPDGLAQALLLDVISGVIAAYIVMLHWNPSEFQTGGLLVDLYRMVYRIFLSGEAKVSQKGTELVREVFIIVCQNVLKSLTN
ncbi:hypothetical protein TERTU_0476 [Teredinibacter turnerae T7901]|uniref:Uncharacterized protein n=1 Tax=Teredinibacter turnerae (strain ATCC 39867 / T7901) TaxID=377629 RepID=C5BMY4_TERTT|nr:hypothetical protein [Teredinibacter turnerae]ACR14296.1 hypothetical protein TERTU_0476 [Teredinibacter turnerae T7901]